MHTRAPDLIGNDPRFLEALAAAENAAKQNISILICGETGSGKGRVAEFIHEASGRSGRFLSINCAAFQPNLFESELFGYMKGAFTGAEKNTPGLFETAHGGTLFLDEIADTPREIQPKLLRAVEQGVIRRVGGREEIPVDVRLLSATNKDLTELIRASQFREDLYYRINSFLVALPPLRERPADVPLLARHFLDEASRYMAEPRQLSDEALKVLTRYHWPGNIRELNSSILSACANAGGSTTIEAFHLPSGLLTASVHFSQDEHLKSFRRLYLQGATDRRQWAQFLLALQKRLGSSRFSRKDILECLRHTRGPGPSDNTLAHEWQRRLRAKLLSFGLAVEEGARLRIDLEACQATLKNPETQPAAPAASPNEPIRNGNLPIARTRFVGRKPELEKLGDLVREPETNIMTIIGPGGTGKTRTAIQLARTIAGEFPGGVWFSDLSHVSRVEGVAYGIAQSLGVQLTENEPAEQSIAGILKARRPMLLILDNFEQTEDSAARAVDLWSRSAPHVQFLVTSRVPLGIEGEREFELCPLGLPAPYASLEEIENSDAVRLFIERTRLQNVDFNLTRENAASIVSITRRLEGMPLALELAAARTSIMEPAELSSRLDELFTLLKTSRRDVSDRHSSLEAAIDWSYQLLDEVEREAFKQLSVFRGGFFLDAGERLLDLSRFPNAPTAVDAIQSLRQKSLLRSELTDYGLRFGMYQVISDFAVLKWRREAADDAIRERRAAHARFYLAYAREWAGRVKTSQAVEVLDRLDLERGNLGAALETFRKLDECHARSGFVELVFVADTLLRVRGPITRRQGLLREACDLLKDETSPERARALLALAEAELDGTRPEEAQKLIHEADGIVARCNSPVLKADLNFRKAIDCARRAREDEALRLLQASRDAYAELGERESAARARLMISQIVSRNGRLEEARKLVARAEGEFRALGVLTDLATATFGRGIVALRTIGREQEALEAFGDAADLALSLGDHRRTYFIRTHTAVAKHHQRCVEDAIALHEKNLAEYEPSGFPSITALACAHLGDCYLELDRLDKAEAALNKCEPLFAGQQRWYEQAAARVALVNCALRRKDPAEARRRLARVLEVRGAELPRIVPLRLAAESEIASISGALSVAEKLSRKAVELHSELGIRPALPLFRALAVRAQCLSGLARAKDARKVAQNALKVGQMLGYTHSDPSAAIRAELATLGPVAS